MRDGGSEVTPMLAGGLWLWGCPDFSYRSARCLMALMVSSGCEIASSAFRVRSAESDSAEVVDLMLV
jgi:hypothetical protein